MLEAEIERIDAASASEKKRERAEKVPRVLMHEEIKSGGKERKGYRVMAGCCQKQSLQFLLPHSLLQCDVLQGGG